MSVSVVGEAAVVGSSLCRLVPRMSQLTLGVAVAQSETRSSPPSPKNLALIKREQKLSFQIALRRR